MPLAAGVQVSQGRGFKVRRSVRSLRVSCSWPRLATDRGSCSGAHVEAPDPETGGAGSLTVLASLAEAEYS
jgi:hypothetical protein